MTYKEKLNECLAAIKHGDQTRYQEFHDLTYGPFLNVARSYLMNKSDATAIMSDLYLRIIYYADKYDTSRDAYTYIWQIVKNRAYDSNKKHLKENTVNIDEVPIIDNIDYFERADIRMDIVRALNCVGHINALIVVWTYRDGLTQTEIGKRLKISASAVCQRLSKTLEKLKIYLKNH